MIEGQYQHPILVQHNSSNVLPRNLISEVNQAYFLHLLAINPDRILPPGKSLISIVVQEKLGQNGRDDMDQRAKLQQRVAQAMHTAFWDAVGCPSLHPKPYH